MNRMNKGYCLNVCTQKKQLKKLGTLKQLRKELLTDIINMPCSGMDSIKTKQNNSVYLCNSTPIVPQ